MDSPSLLQSTTKRSPRKFRFLDIEVKHFSKKFSPNGIQLYFELISASRKSLLKRRRSVVRPLHVEWIDDEEFIEVEDLCNPFPEHDLDPDSPVFFNKADTPISERSTPEIIQEHVFKYFADDKVSIRYSEDVKSLTKNAFAKGLVNTKNLYSDFELTPTD